MASVEAIGLGAISSNSVKSVNNTASVSVNTNQFDRFLQDRQTSASNTAGATDNSKSQKGSVIDKEVTYSKRDEVSKVSDDSSVMNENYEDKNLAETANDLKTGIRDVLKENLGIDNDEIDNTLETMGIVITDLMNPQILQQFVLQLNGGQENVDFLTNEALLSDFSNLLQELESFLSDDMKSLLMMMEEVETPMTLDDFLAQQGMVDAMEEVTVETFTVQTNVSKTQVESDSMAGTLLQDKDVDMDQIEKISIRTSDESVTVKGEASSQQSKNSSDNANNTFSDGALTQSSSDMLFSNSIDTTDNVTTPLFAEQFDVAQNNVTQLFDNNISGNQRMQQMIDIVNQVSDSIKSSINTSTTTMEVQLNPESLGKVFLSVVSKEGIMTATFRVQTDEAKNALESQIYTLRENLEAKNLKVESVEVQVSDFNFSQSNGAEGQEQSNSAQTGKKKFKFDSDISETSDIPDEESANQVREQVMRDSGGSIDYTA